MSISQTRKYEQKRFELGELSQAIRRVLEPSSVDLEEMEFDVGYQDGETHEGRELSIEDISRIHSLSGPGNPHYLRFVWHDKKEQYCYVKITCYGTSLDICAGSPTGETTGNILSEFENSLDLVPYSSPETEEDGGGNWFQRLERRVTELERRLETTDDKLSCFLTYRFHKHSKVYALELTRFLQLIGVEVVSGAGYEPRRVSDKVKDCAYPQSSTTERRV